ncbi:MAG: vWA domain-containing protein [Gemmobacter sp.]
MTVFAKCLLLPLTVGLALAAPPVLAQERANMMVVLDASGSMWGQIGGRTKIELAREALSGVLSEAGQDMQIGLMAYGHRQRGQCGDIETLVPIGPAGQTVPGIIDRAYAIKPRGMTPLVDSVMAAAQTLAFREQAATVVLLTDGIETCGGDPCALGRMLAAQGIDFTAHVVGFDMTDAEQRQVSCLASETGGLFLAAGDADDLGAALRNTILAGNDGPALAYVPPPPPEPAAVVGPREVQFFLRDVAGGEVLTGRALNAVNFLPLDEDGAVPDAVALRLGDRPWTLDGTFLPGRYEIQITRAGNRGTTIRTALAFEVPEGLGAHYVDLVIAARLRLTALAHSGLPMPPKSGNLPFATYGSASGRADFRIHPIIGGAIDPGTDFGGVNALDIALPPGDYLVRGTLAKTFARERLIRVSPGETLDYTFDFEAGRVFVEMRDGQGQSATRQTVRFFDGAAERDFMYGGGERTAQWKPFYLPQGIWRIAARNETGAKERAEGLAVVPAPGTDTVVSLRAGEGLSDAMRAQLLDEGNPGCLAFGAGGEVCFVEAVTPASMARDLPGATPSGDLLAARYTGTWDAGDRMMALVQQGRRVWGDIHAGGKVQRLYGELAADGRTLRGTMTGIGIFEFRLSPDGLAFTGGSSHFGGGDTGTRVAESLANASYAARKLSAAAPLLRLADGTEADMHPAFQRNAVPAFEAFMERVRDPDPVPAAEAAPAPARQGSADGFVPEFRFDFADAAGRPALSFVFGPNEAGGSYGSFNRGFALLRAGWCGGAACAGDTLVPVGGPTDDEVPNAVERLFKSGVFPALDLLEQGIAAFEMDESQWPNQRLFVHVLKAPYEEGRQLGAGRDQVLRSFGPFTGGPVKPASLEGFDNLPGSGMAAIPPAADPPVEIGRIDLLPTGIYATEDILSGEPLSQTFARLSDPERMPARGGYCATNPTVVHPDGLIAQRSLKIGQAASAGSAFQTDVYRICGQSGPILSCDEVFNALGPVPQTPNVSFAATLAQGPDDSFAIIPNDPGVATRLYQNCMVPTDLADSLRPAADGRTMLEHMGEREDGGPPLFAAATGAIPADPGSAPVTGAAVDFAALQGVWGQDRGGDLLLACRYGSALVRPDGRVGFWGGNAAGQTDLLAQLSCDPSGACVVTSTNRAGGAPTEAVTLAAEAGRLSLCAGADCTGFLRCPMADLPPDLASSLAAQMDAADGRGTAAGAGGAGGIPAGGPGETPAAQIPPGVWLVQAEGEPAPAAPGTPAFAAACYDMPTVVFPDGLSVSLERQAGASGPMYSEVYTETCTPEGTADWPILCRSQDANVADPAAATFETRARLFARADGTVRQVVEGADGAPDESYVYHACTRADGTGINLSADPLGPVLTAAAQQVRAGTPAGVPRIVPAPVEAPAASTGTDLRLTLTGLWFPRRDGRPLAEWSADEQAEACFSSPGYMQPDGRFTAFEMRDGEDIPAANALMLCQADLDCSFYISGKDHGGKPDGLGRITPTPDGAEVCVEGTCMGISRCAAPQWSARERASGLAAAWEARVLGGN